MTTENNSREKLRSFGKGKAVAVPAGQASEPTNAGGRTVSAFRQVLESRKLELEALLPKHVTFDRFRATALEAVRQNPELLKCDARSMLGAVSKAASDGLLPDGRDGVITHYKDKRTGKLVAAWNPMANGLRKRARELDGIIVDADVVHANDHWDFKQGDNPRIVHERPPLGQARGEVIGAYAIFRQGDHILHREVMDIREIQLARAQSRAPDSLMWKTFFGEGAKKVVVRRGFKTVQCSEALSQIVARDDELFDFAEPGPVVDVAAGDAQQIDDLPPGDEGHGQEIEGEATEVDATPSDKPARAAKAAKGSRKAKAKKPAPAAPVASQDGTASKTPLQVRTLAHKAATIDALNKLWATEVEPFDWDDDKLATIKQTFDDVRVRLSR